MKYISVCTGIAKLVSAILIFTYVHHPQDGVLAVIFQSGGMMIAGTIGFAVALWEIDGRFVLPSKSSLWATFCDGWHLFVSTAAISLYTNTNLVRVGLLAGNVQAGYFSAAEKIVRAMTGLISPFMQAFFPYVNSLMSQSRESALRAISHILRWTAGGTFVVSVLLLLFANLITTLVFGSRATTDCVIVIRWISFLPFLIGVSNVLGLQTMLPFGFDRQFSRILLASGLLNIVLAIPFIHFVGASGAGISVLITEACVTLTMIVFLQCNDIHVLSLEPAG
jgi:O-antigen/teichoic acid export membrane protein